MSALEESLQGWPVFPELWLCWSHSPTLLQWIFNSVPFSDISL